MKRAPFPGLVAAACALMACGDGTPGDPTSGALVTFAVQQETFRVWLPSSEQVAAARAAQAGGPARIPNGRILPGTQYNTGWSWHLEDVAFAEVTIELWCVSRKRDEG